MNYLESWPESNGNGWTEPVEQSREDSSQLPASVSEASLRAEEDAPTADLEQAEFDALHALTRLLVGGALESKAEITHRLAVWEAFLREEMAAGELVPETDAETDRSLLRHALIGLVFEGGDQVRRGAALAWRFQKVLAKTAVRTAHPLTNSRLMQPIQRRLDHATQRGQDEITRWIQRGQDEDPISRQLARLAFAEIVDEFISQLAVNKEVQELVQQQGVSLAGEVVDQVRERTFTADTIIERIARSVTRRAPRLTPPSADLSELPPGTLTSGIK